MASRRTPTRSVGVVTLAAGALLAGALVAGCAATVSGNPSFDAGNRTAAPSAGGGPAGGGIANSAPTPSSPPSGVSSSNPPDRTRTGTPTGPDSSPPTEATSAPTLGSPGGSSSTSPTAMTTASEPGPLCAALSPERLKQIFGQTVTTSGAGNMCSFQAGSEVIPVNLLDAGFSVAEQKTSTSEAPTMSLTIDGRPALIGESGTGDIIVSLSSDPSTEGVLKAYLTGEPRNSPGQRTAIALLEALLSKYKTS